MIKKIFVISVLVIFALTLSGCGKKTNDQNNQNQKQGNNQNNEIANPNGSYSINELFSMNKSMKCTWKESATNGSEVSNVLYISGKKFYQDVTMGDVGHAYTISDGEYLYIWNDFTGVASKMKITETPANAGSGQNNSNNSAGLEQKRNFICESWNADDSLFNPPADKNFKDVTVEINQAVDGLKENSTDYKQKACDLCRQAPAGEVRENCLASAGCN
jgi:hypothetical protein